MIELGVPPLTERSWDSKMLSLVHSSVFVFLCRCMWFWGCLFSRCGYMGVDDVVFVLKSKGGDGCEYRFRNAECALRL